jgi:hypothetical protein
MKLVGLSLRPTRIAKISCVPPSPIEPEGSRVIAMRAVQGWQALPALLKSGRHPELHPCSAEHSDAGGRRGQERAKLLSASLAQGERPSPATAPAPAFQAGAAGEEPGPRASGEPGRRSAWPISPTTSAAMSGTRAEPRPHDAEAGGTSRRFARNRPRGERMTAKSRHCRRSSSQTCTRASNQGVFRGVQLAVDDSLRNFRDDKTDGISG